MKKPIYQRVTDFAIAMGHPPPTNQRTCFQELCMLMAHAMYAIEGGADEKEAIEACFGFAAGVYQAWKLGNMS